MISRQLGQFGAGANRLDVSADVSAGRLVVLLADHPGNASPLSMVCPHRKQISPAVSQLYKWLRSQFSRMEPV